MTPLARQVALMVPLLALSVACEEAPRPAAPAPSASVRPSPKVDEGLAAALEEVNAPATEPRGPPPAGVFPAGAADREHRAGAPPKLTLGGAGGDPTVRLPSLGTGGWKRKGTVQVSIRTGPQSAMPTVDLAVTLEAPAPKEPAAVAAGVAKVVASKPAATQPGALGPEIAAAIGRMKGARLALEVAPGGGGRFVGTELPKGADEGLGAIVEAAAEALAGVLVPFPAEPVGPGAFWMVASRERHLGLDAVVYRMFKVEAVEADEARLAVTTRRYVAGGQLGLAGLPPHQVVQFAGEGAGTLSVGGKTGAVTARRTESLQAGVTQQGTARPQGQVLGIQIELSTSVTLEP